MTKKLNTRDSVFANAFTQTTQNATDAFWKSLAVLNATYSRVLNIERSTQGNAFDVDAFWSDNAIAETVIESTFRRPKTDAKGQTVTRKGLTVFETVQFNRRDVLSASGFVRAHVRTRKGIEALITVHGSLANASRNVDRLGNVLNMVRRLNAAGLVSASSVGNDAKNAAIEAYRGDAAMSDAKRALIGTLYGKPVTSAQVKTVTDALTKWSSVESDKRVALTFDGIFNPKPVQSVGKKPVQRRTRASRPTVKPVTVQPDASSVQPETIAA